MKREPLELVIGADGMIGAALLRSLRAAGRQVIGTSRRPGGNHIHLDLCDAPHSWQGPPISVAYICAAVARLDACRNDPAGSARVNIDGTCRLAKALAATGAFVLYLSTNQVFDGTKPCRRPEETPCPRSEYGRQKAVAEAGILELGDSAAVLRLTKIFGESVPLFTAWATALGRGESIRPFADMWMAPLPVACVTEVMKKLGEQQRSGIYHLSGERDVSYAEAGVLAAQLLVADPTLVEPIATRDADPATDTPPRYTTLDVAGLPEALGIELPKGDATLRSLFGVRVCSQASEAKPPKRRSYPSMTLYP